MKTKIILLLGVVALITLSFTFSTNQSAINHSQEVTNAVQSEDEIVGFISDEVVK